MVKQINYRQFIKKSPEARVKLLNAIEEAEKKAEKAYHDLVHQRFELNRLHR